MSAADASRDRLALLVLGALVATCGGRALPSPSDAGPDAAGVDADAGEGRSCAEDNSSCPDDAPYCCGFEAKRCFREPEPHPNHNWYCYENPPDDSIVPSTCLVHEADDHPEQCPETHPYCCTFFRGEHVCADHDIVGFQCEPM